MGAFWSITMYDLRDFYLVANPIGRYSIGDRTPGLRRDADGLGQPPTADPKAPVRHRYCVGCDRLCTLTVT